LGVAIATPGSSLTAGSLTLAAGSAAPTFDLGTFPNPTAPLMQVGTLSASGIVSINITGGSLMMVPGTITLIKYANLNGAPTFTTGTLPPHLQGQVVLNAGSVDLVITGVQGFRWTGVFSSDWDTATQNWISGLNNAPSAYQDGFKTEFLDGAVRGTVNIAGAVFPALIHVDNTALAYSFAGGTIATPLIRKSGTNTLTRLDGGADQVTELELNEGYFVAEASFDADFSSTLTDTSEGLGTLVKAGPGILALFSTNSTYDGHFEVREGTLRVGVTDALGSTNGSILIRSGASLDVNDIQSPQKAVMVSGIGHNGQGAITELSGVAGVQHNLTDVTLVGDTTFGCANGGRWDIRVRAGSGVGPGLQGNGFNVTKIGGGTLSIACQRHNYGAGVAVPYWEMNLGDVFITEGTLTFAESLTPGNSSKIISISPGATFSMFDLGHTNPILRTITLNSARIAGNGNALHTNMLNGDIQITGDNNLSVSQAALILNGNISGNGSIACDGTSPGRIFFNGINTYTGDTYITNILFGGSGTLAGNLTMIGGTNSPGYGVGTLTVNGNATLAGVTWMELNPGQPQNSDRLVVGGTLSLAGDLVVVLATGASAPNSGEVFQLFNKAGVGAFANITLPTLPAGLSWDTTSLAVNGTIAVAGSLAQPSIGTTFVSDGNFIFTGTGGVEGGTYHVLTATEVAAPLAGWTPIATNVFGPGGTFAYTNSVGTEPARFFRVRIP
jgi:autotransporter-associated beta strand protein